MRKRRIIMYGCITALALSMMTDFTHWKDFIDRRWA